ncbi:MAG: hypothetical protein GY871_04010 [Actinomycetales bacterium]|nr:hypothetical protein [Actinomycetales bacterium]
MAHHLTRLSVTLETALGPRAFLAGGYYDAGQRATFDSLGAPLEPEERESFELLEVDVELQSGGLVELASIPPFFPDGDELLALAAEEARTFAEGYDEAWPRRAR